LLAAISFLLGEHVEAEDVDWENVDLEVVRMQLETIAEERTGDEGRKRVKLPRMGYLRLMPE